jgi:hypothetical protein
MPRSVSSLWKDLNPNCCCAVGRRHVYELYQLPLWNIVTRTSCWRGVIFMGSVDRDSYPNRYLAPASPPGWGPPPFRCRSAAVQDSRDGAAATQRRYGGMVISVN